MEGLRENKSFTPDCHLRKNNSKVLMKYLFSLPDYVCIISVSKDIQICCNLLQRELICLTDLRTGHVTVTKVET